MKTQILAPSSLTCRQEVYQWHATLCAQLPALTRSQAWGLALWSWGVVLCQSCSLSAVSLLYCLAFEEPQNTARQRLREWYYEACDKVGPARRQVSCEACFAPLLSWVLQQWSGTQLTLALDATSLQDRFVVLCVSVLYRGCALPVAWCVLPANRPGSWRPHWLRLLRLLRPGVPASYEVLVLADRGLYACWLFRRIVRLGWHPFLRINRGGTFRVAGRTRSQPLLVIAKELGGWGSVSGVAFQGQRALPCTLGVYWDKGCTDPWLILSDLAPPQCQACWYGTRAWIEHGFKLTKSEGWQWQRTRMKNTQRVNRMWLVLAVATLWVVTQGSHHEDQSEQHRSWKNRKNRKHRKHTVSDSSPKREVSLFRRGWIAQIVALWKGEPLLWQHHLKPEPRPQPNRKRLFFDSS